MSYRCGAHTHSGLISHECALLAGHTGPHHCGECTAVWADRVSVVGT